MNQSVQVGQPVPPAATTIPLPVYVYVPAQYQGMPPPPGPLFVWFFFFGKLFVRSRRKTIIYIGPPCLDLLPWDAKAKKEVKKAFFSKRKQTLLLMKH